MKKITTILAIAFMAVAAFAQTEYVVFEENFDDAAADLRWTIGESSADNSSDFKFDYISAGIPAAPNGGGLGVKFESNIADGEGTQIHAFPVDQSFSGHYILQVDLWMATDTSGSGTTEFAVLGVMHTDEIIPSNNGYEFAFTGENGSARDIRVVEEGIELRADDGEGGYRLDTDGALTQNNDDLSPYSNAYEGDMPFGKWLTLTVEVSPDDLIWKVNDTLWVSMAPAFTQDGNISIGYADWFSSVADPTGSMFGLYDNVKVTKIAGVGVEDVTLNRVSVYPNPASGIINVVVSERSSLELINSIGQTVQRNVVDAGQTTVNISDVRQGIYFARFTSESGSVEIHKVVVK
ncbi:MAG: T9SS type A sorting domain-containing protein [Bacteroidota bacterium]